MKTKQIMSILTLLAICLFTNAQDKPHCIFEDCGFKPGQIVYLFGDHVQLRDAPTTDSKVIKTLPIGMHLVVQEKHENSWRYKGVDHHFYKVDYKGIEGYILGGLLALDKITIKGVTHLFGQAKINNEDFLLIRSLQDDEPFKEKSTLLSNGQFMLSHLGTKGLADIDGILHLDYIAESCGVEGGGIYFFQQKGQLYQVARLSQVADAGSYYFWEEFTFPEDEGGIVGKIRYDKEIGELYDEAANWKKSSMETKTLVWNDTKLKLAKQ